MNQSYARVNAPYATRKVFGVLYKNNARALLSRILCILNSDWLQHARSIHGVYEWITICKILIFTYHIQNKAKECSTPLSRNTASVLAHIPAIRPTDRKET